MRPHGHYRVDPSEPRAKAVCDRCGFWYQLSTLKWQYEWAGPRLQNLRFYVCDSCLDKPQINLKTIVIPADPVPVYNPRPEAFVSDNSGVIQPSTGITGQSSLRQRLLVAGVLMLPLTVLFLNPRG